MNPELEAAEAKLAEFLKNNPRAQAYQKIIDQETAGMSPAGKLEWIFRKITRLNEEAAQKLKELSS